MTTEIKKALLPRIVADRIEELREGFSRSNEYIAELWMRTGGGVPAATTDLRQVSFDTLIVALLVGYDREMTEEERREEALRELKRVYENSRRPKYYDSDTHDLHAGIARGIELALNALAIKVEGVNE